MAAELGGRAGRPGAERCTRADARGKRVGLLWGMIDGRRAEFRMVSRAEMGAGQAVGGIRFAAKNRTAGGNKWRMGPNGGRPVTVNLDGGWAVQWIGLDSGESERRGLDSG